ncbi:MAG TPA: iron-containing alcohol dehydrogenase [Opitutaceae bacterium]|nr:iron-containing alcohol dehydrogenase [Opitutaceae bacterium]
MKFEFATAGRIVFGTGTLRQIGGAARGLGRKALVMTGANPKRAEGLIEALTAEGIAATAFPVTHEPTVATVAAGSELARSKACDLIIGLGGGSAIDAAKAVAALVTNPGDVLEYLEVIGQARPLAVPAAPCIAIPTTAGTGAEVTRNAVLASPEHKVKASLRNHSMLPRIAWIDPALTLDLPPALTASTGLDALTQLIEPYVSCRANPLTDGLCLEGLRRAAGSLKTAVHDGGNVKAREDMSIASLFSGLALANAGLGAVHGFAAVIGGMFRAPHGAVCAALLAPATSTNVRAIRERRPDDGETLQRYATVAQTLTQDPRAGIEEGIAWIRELVAELRIPRLADYGITAGDLPEISDKAAHASSMKANPLPLTSIERLEILQLAL